MPYREGYLYVGEAVNAMSRSQAGISKVGTPVTATDSLRAVGACMCWRNLA